MSREEILQQITERIFSSVITKSIVFVDQLAILINSEPPSSFQDYFRKFKSRLDHMIYMTPIVALEFLNATWSDIDIRKVGLNGLISLLTYKDWAWFVKNKIEFGKKFINPKWWIFKGIQKVSKFILSYSNLIKLKLFKI